MRPLRHRRIGARQLCHQPEASPAARAVAEVDGSNCAGMRGRCVTEIARGSSMLWTLRIPMAARCSMQNSPACVGAMVWACAAVVFRQARAIGRDISTHAAMCCARSVSCSVQAVQAPSAISNPVLHRLDRSIKCGSAVVRAVIDLQLTRCHCRSPRPMPLAQRTDDDRDTRNHADRPANAIGCMG